MTPQPIENHGVIGDLKTAALVSMTGSIDFMCFPRFDSPSIFADLLDPGCGGHFQIAPVAGEFKHHQRYFPDTNILLTRFLGDDGVAAISDFMAIAGPDQQQHLVRRVKVIRGEIKFRMVCAPKFDYGRADHTVEKPAGPVVFQPRGKGLPALRLRSSVPLRLLNGTAVAEFKLKTNQSAWFVLEDADGGESASVNADYVSDAFKATMNYWLAWVARSRYRGYWRETVNRSALTLKLLTSEPHGSMVAAPTFGLPEHVGGRSNWDYRFTWVRDASFTLYALMRLGYTEEAAAFMGWIEQRCRELKPGRPLQAMYRVDGGTELSEKTLKHFAGYQDSRPVRIGNAAGDQLQLDIYGELLDSVLIYDKHGGPISYDFWLNLSTLIDWVCKNWRRADNGIWEVRQDRRQFLYSRVLCWVALDRGIQLARRRSFPAPLARWIRTRDEIFHSVYRQFWNPRLKSFVQFRGANTVDASALLMPLIKIISPTDPRWRSTLKLIEQTLVEDSLVYRYRPAHPESRGNPPGEGTFSMCSFWYVECLTRAGDLRQARFIFEKALGYANHLGLFAEQLGQRGEHLGNFPQALTHIALISAAWTLDDHLARANPVV